MASPFLPFQILRQFSHTVAAIALAASIALPAPQERLLVDSTRMSRPDTIKVDQTTVRFIPAIGSLKQLIDTTDALNSRQFIWTDEKYVADLLWRLPGLFVRELGEIGQPGQLNAFGMDERGISVQLDGRPLRDPISGTYNLYDIPLEYIEQLELISGAHSSYFGSNAPGATINVVTHQYNNVRPMTKIRYLQGPFEHILSDGIFAQNVARGLNVMVGFQRHVTEGRFPNTKYDSWNVRSRLRFNYSDRLNVWLSDFYKRSKAGFNGGIDTKKSPSIYDEVTAIVKSRNASQIIASRDVTLGATARLLSDSTMTTQAILYYSTIEREYQEGGGLFGPPGLTDLHISSYWGLKLQQQSPLPLGRLEIGTDFERRFVEQSRTVGERSENYFAMRGRAELRFGDLIATELSARAERLRNESSISIGVRFSRQFNNWLSLFADYSRSYRLPTPLELYWTDSTVTRSGSVARELHTFRGLGIRLQLGTTLDWSLSAFDRAISDAILFTPVTSSDVFPRVKITSTPEISVAGVASNISVRAWNFELSNALTYTNYKEGDVARLVFPKFSAHAELAYRNVFLNGALDAKLALRVKLASRQNGLQFVPPLLVYAAQEDTQLGAFSTLDLYAIIKLSDAYLTLVWENPLDVNYTLTPVYPMPGRNIKLGVNWVFTD